MRTKGEAMGERFQLFTVLISTLNRSIRRIKTEEMADFGLKSGHVSCLYYLHREGKLTAKELCDICEEDKANISRAIKDMEGKGLITCTTGRSKRYQSPLELTTKGKEMALELDQKIEKVLQVSSEGMTKEERDSMYRCLAIIDKNLQSICNQYEK
jgi:DNA-binding MarR family transcriptional regulator